MSLWLSSLLVLLILLVLLWWFVLRPRRAGGPNAPPLVTVSTVVPLPVIGVLCEFFKSPNTMVQRCYRDYGSVFTIPIAYKRLTFLIGPEAQGVVFKASDDVLSQKEVYDFMKPVFGPNVVYDATKRDRQVQFQAFAKGLRASRMESYVQKVEEETRMFLKNEWPDKEGVVDLQKTLAQLTILTASRCLHGDDVRTHIFKEVEELYHDLDAGLTPLSVFWPTAPTTAHAKRDAARQQMIQLFRKVIQERRENPNCTDGTDILSLFMDIKYKDGTQIKVEEVTGLLIALLFAGQHTSSITSTWTSLFVANDSKVMDRVMEEQRSVLNNDMKKTLTNQDLQGMELLHNCIREALRLCPTFIMVLRRAECDIPIIVDGKKHIIPKGDFVVVSPTVSMRLPSAFSDPDTFDPDRFAPPREEHKKKPYAYLGFGGGVHSCMGQNFAFLQIKTILSILFREYEIERVAEQMPAIGYDDMVVGPKGDCRVRYKKRM